MGIFTQKKGMVVSADHYNAYHCRNSYRLRSGVSVISAYLYNILIMHKDHKIIFLIPVFRESDNLEITAKRIIKYNKNCQIIFVATILDKPEDIDTLDRLKVLSGKNGNISFVSNNERGLGKAYKLGFEHIKKNTYEYDHICTVDADGSHDIEMLDSISREGRGADIVVASRYVDGGEILKWNFFRDMGSRAVNKVIKFFSGHPVRDITSGYKLYSKFIVDILDFENFRSNGFVFQAESLLRAKLLHATFAEAPYKFIERNRGRSKFRLIDFIEYSFVLFPLLIQLFTKRIINLIKTITWFSKLGINILQLKIINHFKEYKKPYRLLIKITDKCNFNCPSCGNWRTDSKKELSEEKLKEIFRKYHKDLFFLTITGGEPFFDDDKLLKIIKLAKKECPNLYYISINTNGYYSQRISGFTRKVFERYDFVKLYFGINYFNDDETAIRKTGRVSTFENLTDTNSELSKLKQMYKNRLSVYDILTVNSVSEVKNLAPQKKDLWINFVEIEDFYNNKGVSVDMSLGEVEKNNAVSIFKSANQKNLSILNKVYLFFLEKQLSSNGRPMTCWAGKNRSYVDSNGEEYMCTRKTKKYDKNSKVCRGCWTPCEAVFDIIQ